MILCDRIIENNSIILENLDKNSSSSWSTASSEYGSYYISYSKPLILGNIYYFRCKYKFTTTNQSPTWVTIYSQGGSVNTNASLRNPVAGTEYTISGYTSNPTINVYSNLNGGTVYNGPSTAIDGMLAQTKEMVVYDITTLHYYLLSLGLSTSIDTTKTWCDNNLQYKAPGIMYDLSDLLDDSTKVTFKTGNICANAIECDGMEYYSVSDRLRNNTYFDTGTGVYVYNNAGNGAVTFERVDAKAQNSPFYPEHKYVLKITTNGSATPSCGGFYAAHTAAANKIFVEKFIAKVPIGYRIYAAYNSQGDGATVTYLTPTAGTGEWEEYAILYKCGSTGSFSTGGHVYIHPVNSSYSLTSVTWYVAYVNNCDISENEELKNYTVLPNNDRFRYNKLFSKSFDEVNLFPNGDGSDTNMPLPNGWSWDTEDIAGNAKASLVQSVGGSGYGTLSTYFKIKPNCRYKISYWVKCKGDMTYFLTAIPYYATKSNGDKIQLNSSNVYYDTGTLTKLTADLNPGDTTVSVKSTANWAAKTGYYSLAFKTNNWIYASYHDLGTWFNPNGSNLGVISEVTDSTTLQLKTPYTGTKKTSGTFICHGINGATFTYPVVKSTLPTDNTWKYVEGYFGTAGKIWDGAGSAWTGIPYDTTDATLYLNMYSNDGTVPIKFADVRIEEVSNIGNGRQEQKIQFKKFNN